MSGRTRIGRSRTGQPRAGTDARPHVVLATRVFTPEPVAAAFREQALVDALAEAGARVTVLTTRVPGGAPDAPGVERFPVKRDHQGQVRGYVSYLSFDLPLFLRLLVARRVDAIVLEPPPTTGVVGMVAAFLRRVPYTFYAADIWSDATDSVEGVPGPVRAVVRGAEMLVWKRAARVLTISPGVQHRLEELIGRREHLRMIGNGIDTATFIPEGPIAEEVADAPCLVYAGTVSEWQGAEVFVEAFARVQQQRPEARLLFFSEGSGREQLQQLVAARGIGGVEFHAKVPPVRMASILRGARAGLSSITPGLGYEFALPTKIYAATACGTPVIHAGEGAAHDRIRDGHLGWACDHTADEVATAMLAALDGEDAPSSPDLRAWTLENASLQGCARQGASEVLATLRT
jgi:glycosyltransferase involved in cell wall biosynthesis